MIEQLREAFESACEKLECNLLEMDGKARAQRSGRAPILPVAQVVQRLKR